MSTLIKIGGSLTPNAALEIFHLLKKFKTKEKIFFFPGGGLFADLIRTYRKEAALRDFTTHRMALAALEQNAFLLSDICQCRCLTRLSQIKKNKVSPVVIAPYQLLTQKWPFSGYNLNIDVFSSDSSALYLAHLLKARCIIATDVDGVCLKDPKTSKKNFKLLPTLSAQDLKKIKRGGPLDETVARLMIKYKLNIWVVNGKYPQRILEIIRYNSVSKGTFVRYA
jgi:aspartokinase-like uncharacterized kinase